ncbi:hypothetical protein B5S32_g4898 [[Candida] boidinii]|nr:hypothetical protein B5S32_g4898 [[Candida] boidinii]
MSDSSKKFEFGFGNSASSGTGFGFTVPTSDTNKTDNDANDDIDNDNNVVIDDDDNENEDENEDEDEEIEEIMIPDESDEQQVHDEDEDSEAFSEIELPDDEKYEEDNEDNEDNEDEDNSEPEDVLIDDSDNMNDNSSDIAIEDENKEEHEDEDEDDESEIEIDVNTGIPITKLPYKEMPIQRKDREWVNKGKILNFSNQASSNSSCLFLSSNLDAPQKQDITKIKPQETSLYFYQLPGEIDTSKEYIQFINKIYTSFEVLLLDQNYKSYIKNSNTDEDEDDIKRDDLSNAFERIGVIENYKDETEEKELTLNRLINTIIDNLNHMITIKLKNEELNNNNNNQSDSSGSDNATDDDDETIFKYEEILYVLNLFSSIKFAHPIERIASLSSWVNRADIQPTNQLVDEILNQDKSIPVFKKYKFWSLLIKKLILRGLFNEAISAIETSGFKDYLDSENSTFYLIINDLISILKNYDFIRFSENLELFIEWKRMCVLLRDNFWKIENNSSTDNDNGVLEILNQIYEILNILSGSSNYILDNSSSWYESLLSHYLYSMPSIDLIREYLLVSRNRFPPDQTSIWENTCIDILEGNYLTVLTSLEYLDKPIATFLGVLLEAKGLLKPYDELDRNINDSDYDLTDDIEIDDELNVVKKKNKQQVSIGKKKSNSVVDSMLKDLSFSCFGNQKLFPIGIGILISINNSNTREIIVEILPHYQCNTNDDFEWCLSVCAKLRLPKTASIIYKTQGQFFKDKGYNLPSLKCFSESGDLQLVTRSIWSLFEASLIQDGPIQDEDLIEYIENGEDIVNAFEDDEDQEDQDEDQEYGERERQIKLNRELVKSNGILRQSMSPYVSLYKYYKNLEKENYYESINQLINLLKFKYLPKYYMCLILIKILPFINQDDNLIYLNLNDYSSDKIVKELNEISKKSIRNLIESNKLIYLIQYLNEYEEILQNDPIVLKQSNYLIKMFKDYNIKANNNVNIPNNVEELLLKLRKGLGFEISLKFVNF